MENKVPRIQSTRETEKFYNENYKTRESKKLKNKLEDGKIFPYLWIGRGKLSKWSYYPK